MATDNDSREHLIAELAALRLRVLPLEGRPGGRRPSSKSSNAGDGRSEAMLRTSAAGIFGVDETGAVTFFNRAAAEITGWPTDDALGAAAVDVLATTAGGPHPMASVFEHGATEHFERFPLLRRDGGEKLVRLSGAPLLEEGRVNGALVTLHEAAALRALGEPGRTVGPLLNMLRVAVTGDSFKDQAEQVLDHLLAALGADRAVLIVADAETDGDRSAPGSLIIEAPPGSQPPGPELPPGKTRPTQADATAAEESDDGEHASVPQLGDDGVNSLAALPIEVQGQVVGMLSVSSSETEYFGAYRVGLMTAAVDCLRALYERSALQRAADERSADAGTMYAVAQALAGPGGFDEKIDAILRLAAGRPAEAAAVGVPDDASDSLRWIAPVIAGTGTTTIEVAGTKACIAGRALHLGLSSVANDTSPGADPAVGSILPNARSAVAVPVKANGSPIGVMLVASPEPGVFTKEHVDLLAAIGDSVGALLANAQLGRKLNAGLEREYERLEAVQDAAAQLTIVGSPDQALQHLVEAARSLVGSKYGGVAVWNLSGNVTMLISSGVADDDTSEAGTSRISQVLGLVRFALVQERKRVIRVNQQSTNPGANAERPLIDSLLSMPFRGKDGSSGAFFLVDKQSAGRFSAEDERLLSLFSAMASVLLDNMRLYGAAERERRTLASIQSSMSEGLLVLDADGQVMFCNPAVEQLFAAEQAELQGKSMRAFILRRKADFETAASAEKLAAMVESGITGTIEVALTRPTRVDLAISLFSIDASPTEQLTGLLVRDVTEERELQRRRDTFVSVASHELRTPMTTVMGFTELLMSRDNPERRDGWLRHIYEDSRRVIDIVDDLLNVSRIQSGKLAVNTQPVDLRALLNDTIEGLRQSTTSHQFVLAMDPDTPRVMADAGKLGQVAANLLSNAIKYSPKGGRITVDARYEPDEGRVVLSDADEGVGIAAKDRDGLFTTFQRIYRPETQGVRGTGLGLFIVRGLLKLMDGTVWLESELDRGTTFYVGLPAEQDAVLSKDEGVTQ